MGVESTTWKLRGLAIAATAFAVGIHTVVPRVGRWLQDLLSAVKLFILSFIVCTGFAALGGHLRVSKPDNLNIRTSFQGTSRSGYNIGTALLDAIFSFAGYDNLNMVSPLPVSKIAQTKLLICRDRCYQKSKTLTGPSVSPYHLPWGVSLFSTFSLILPTCVTVPVSAYSSVLDTNKG